MGGATGSGCAGATGRVDIGGVNDDGAWSGDVMTGLLCARRGGGPPRLLFVGEAYFSSCLAIFRWSSSAGSVSPAHFLSASLSPVFE